MNRVIKFRTFVKDENKMIFGRDALSVRTFTPNFAYSTNEVEVMQFTGLKDKKDAEIYEGDILHQNKYPTPDMKVKFTNGCFVGVSTNRIQEINWGSSSLVKLQELEYEVIGNIYENPELINQ